MSARAGGSPPPPAWCSPRSSSSCCSRLAGAHSLLVQGQIRLDDLDAQLTTEQARYQQLRKDVAEKESPERIVAAAHERGMVTPEDLVYLQPPASDADPGDADVELTRQASGSWTTVKPLLEAPAP